MKTPLLLLALIALPLCAAEIRIPVDRQSRPVAEAVARAKATPHPGTERIETAVTLGKRLVAGNHEFKVLPRNSRGTGLESDLSLVNVG